MFTAAHTTMRENKSKTRWQITMNEYIKVSQPLVGSVLRRHNIVQRLHAEAGRVPERVTHVVDNLKAESSAGRWQGRFHRRDNVFVLS